MTFGERKSIGQRPALTGRQVSSGIERFLQVVTLTVSETYLSAFASRLQWMQNIRQMTMMTSVSHSCQPDGSVVRMRMRQEERGSSDQLLLCFKSTLDLRFAETVRFWLAPAQTFVFVMSLKSFIKDFKESILGKSGTGFSPKIPVQAPQPC